MDRRNAIHSRHDTKALAQRYERDGVRADVTEIGAAYGEKPAFGVERELSLDGEIAALIVAEE